MPLSNIYFLDVYDPNQGQKWKSKAKFVERGLLRMKHSLFRLYSNNTVTILIMSILKTLNKGDITYNDITYH